MLFLKVNLGTVWIWKPFFKVKWRLRKKVSSESCFHLFPVKHPVIYVHCKVHLRDFNAFYYLNWIWFKYENWKFVEFSFAWMQFVLKWHCGHLPWQIFCRRLGTLNFWGHFAKNLFSFVTTENQKFLNFLVNVSF